jgi:Tol biopolymer transport system component
MTSPRRFEQDLPALLADLYLAGTPDYRDDLVQQIARVRQRPAWTFPERWLPMDLATKAAPGAPRVPWRIVGVVALLAALLAAMLAVYAGSQRLQPAPTFGRAANGSIVYAKDGDIFTADPVTGKATPVVVGPESDSKPAWSLDGTRFAFERKVQGAAGPGLLFVASGDGRGLVQISPEPQVGLRDWSFSPDGRSIVAYVSGGSAGLRILVLASDGTGRAETFDVGATADDMPPMYRPDGSEIMFIGPHPGAGYRDLYALNVASGTVRMIIGGSAGADIHGASWSPDGTHIAYAAHDTNASMISTRTHVVAADGSGDILVDAHPDSIADGGTAWSNDGTRLIINRFLAGVDGEIVRSAIVPIDRSNVGVEMECPANAPPADCTADLVWAPDDSVILGSRDDDFGRPTQHFLVDPTTGRIRPSPWTATGHPAMQRRAP